MPQFLSQNNNNRFRRVWEEAGSGGGKERDRASRNYIRDLMFAQMFWII